MAAVIHKKGAPDNFVWEEIKVGSPERGQVRLRSTAVGVNFADTYHRAGIPHPMIVGDPPVVVGFEGVGEIEELGPGVTGFSVGERVCTCLPPIGAYSQERLYPADKLIKVPKDLPLDDVQLGGLILKGMVGTCAAYGQASGVPDPINLIDDLGVRGSLFITRPVLSHYMSNRSEIDAGAKSLFDAVAQGVVASNVVKSFRFGRLQPRTSSSADARQRARSSCFHSSKRPQKGRQNDFGRLRGTQPAEREYHVDHTPRN
jgi:hypothetical protein